MEHCFGATWLLRSGSLFTECPPLPVTVHKRLHLFLPGQLLIVFRYRVWIFWVFSVCLFEPYHFASRSCFPRFAHWDILIGNMEKSLCMYVSQLSFILLTYIEWAWRRRPLWAYTELFRHSGHLGQRLCSIHRIPLGTSDYAFHSWEYWLRKVTQIASKSPNLRW